LHLCISIQLNCLDNIAAEDSSGFYRVDKHSKEHLSHQALYAQEYFKNLRVAQHFLIKAIASHLEMGGVYINHRALH
jgi:hypothetical protein